MEPNSIKAKTRISINSSLIGVCLTVFGIVWAISPNRLSLPILIQLGFAIPLLFVSSLSYSKIGYRKDVKLWDMYGWLTHNTAFIFVLNLIGIMIYVLGFVKMTYFYFFFIWLLMVIYSAINIYYDRKSTKEKLLKLIFFISIQLIFGIGAIQLL